MSRASCVSALGLLAEDQAAFGLALMGVSKTRALVLILVSFIGNVLGIYIIIWFSHLF